MAGIIEWLNTPLHLWLFLLFFAADFVWKMITQGRISRLENK